MKKRALFPTSRPFATRMNRRALPSIMGLLVLPLGCVGPFAPCPQVTRSVSGMIEADLSATGAVDGTFGLLDSLHDDDPRFPDEFSWDVNFAPTNSADSLVTDVHLHEAATDDILYTFSVSVERNPADPDVFARIVSLNPRVPRSISDRPARYQGSVPFDLLYGLVGSDGTYIDVHTVAHPAGALASRLNRRRGDRGLAASESGAVTQHWSWKVGRLHRSEGGRPLRNLHCPSTSFDVSNQNPIERIFPLDTHIALEGNSNERAHT